MTNSDEIHLKPAALVALVVSVLGVAGNMAYTQYSLRPETIRPDPFTGTQGKDLEQRLETLSHEVESVRQAGPVEVRRDLMAIMGRLELIASKMDEAHDQCYDPDNRKR